MKIIYLLFSDVTFGTHEYGFIPRKVVQDPDDDDARYERHLKFKGINARVYDGKVKLLEPGEKFTI